MGHRPPETGAQAAFLIGLEILLGCLFWGLRVTDRRLPGASLPSSERVYNEYEPGDVNRNIGYRDHRRVPGIPPYGNRQAGHVECLRTTTKDFGPRG